MHVIAGLFVEYNIALKLLSENFKFQFAWLKRINNKKKKKNKQLQLHKKGYWEITFDSMFVLKLGLQIFSKALVYGNKYKIINGIFDLSSFVRTKYLK